MGNEVNVMKIQEYFDAEAIEAAVGYLLNGSILQMREDSFGRYNAMIQDGNKKIRVSFTLDSGGYIENSYCEHCGEDGYCVHLLAAFYAAQLMISCRTSDIRDVFREIQVQLALKRLS